MLQYVTQGISIVYSWINNLISALNEGGPLEQLFPLFAIGISISAILLGVKIIKSMVWGS